MRKPEMHKMFCQGAPFIYDIHFKPILNRVCKVTTAFIPFSNNHIFTESLIYEIVLYIYIYITSATP